MSAQTPATLYTGLLSGSVLKIVALDNVTEMTILPISGTVNIQGSANFRNSNAGGTPLASVAVTLPSSTPFTYVSPGAQGPIDGFSIDTTAGVAIIVLKM